ncbi:MAG: helix-turn-helix domain-containing protein [Nitrososphaerales archaeon]
MSELTKYGLSLEEAKVYFTLVKIGASKASTLAASVGFDRVKTYRILQKLVEEKIVDVSLSKPMLFSAHPPQEVLNNLVQQMKNRVKLAEDGLKALLSEWSRLPILTPQMQQPRFRIIQGRVQIYSQIVDMLGKGVREALLLTQGDDLVWLRLGGVQDALVEASKRGVQVRLLTDFDDRLIDVVREYSEGLVVRCARVPSLFRLFILDGCEVIVSTFPLPPSRLDEEGDVGLWTDSLPFASGLRVFFNALWEEALDAQMKIRSLVSGIQPEELKVLRRFDEAKIIVNRMIASASSEIFSLFNIPEQLILPDGVWQIYPVLADKGVNLKLLTTLNLDNLDEVSPLLNAAEVRHIDSLPFQMMIVDKRELLLAPSPSDGDLLYYPIWSNISAYAKVMHHIATRLWDEAEDALVVFRNIKSARQLFDILLSLEGELERLGWVVLEKPEIKGASGIFHRFTAVLQRSSDPMCRLALEWCAEASSQTVLSLLAKLLDVKPAKLVLLTSSDVSQQTSFLASVYGIDVAKVSTSVEIKEKILSLVSEAGSTSGS